MKPIKLVQTMSAALALQATAEASTKFEVKNQGGATDKVADCQPSGVTNHTPDEFSASTTVNLSFSENEFARQFRPAPEWNKKSVHRYQLLTTKEAVSELTKVERLEIRHLDELRYKAENSLTAEQIIDQYRREKTGIEMLQLLKKYVGVAKQGKDSA